VGGKKELKTIDKQRLSRYYINDNIFHLQLEMRLTERRIAAALRQHGYKLTPQRRSVIRTIISSQDHLTPAAIYQKVRQDHPSIGLVTIYRTLEILARLELICELHAGGSCHSYTTGTPEHHHHLICSNCGEVIDFAGYDLAELEQRLCRETGFEIEGHLLEFIGRCRACQK
jgi:Fur family ferric uptake transcriptional regulator